MGKLSVSLFVFGFVLQSIVLSVAKPLDCGCGPYGGGLPFCCPPPPPPVPISFAPVPQPIPIKVCPPQSQSVTIPNIILALLPPTSKPAPSKPCLPPAPRPIVLPLPQPYPLVLPDNGCGC